MQMDNLRTGDERAFVISPPFGDGETAVMYKVLAIDSFEGASVRGTNVEVTYYLNNQLTEADYIADVNLDSALLTLKRLDDGTILNVPASSIVSVSLAEEILQYVDLAIMAPLGLLPANYDTSLLVSEIQTAIESNVGQTVKVSLLRLASSEGIRSSEAAAIESARAAKLSRRPSHLSEVNRLTSELEAAQTYIKSLEKAVIKSLVS